MSTSQTKQDDVNGFWSMGVGEREASLQALEKQIREGGGSPREIADRFRSTQQADRIFTRNLARFAIRGGNTEAAGVRLVRRIMRDSFYGLEEWADFNGVTLNKGQIKAIGKFPFSEEELDSECLLNPGKAVSETHFAWLGIDRYNGPIKEAREPITIMNLQRIFPAGDQPRFYTYGENCWYPKQAFAGVPLVLRWHLDLKEIVPNSARKSWPDMQGMIPDQYYEVPSPIDETTKVLLYRQKTGIYLNQSYYSATNALDSDGYRVIVGYCDDGTVGVSYWRGEADGGVGLGLSRKLAK